jgi:hypothetical protein
MGTGDESIAAALRTDARAAAMLTVRRWGIQMDVLAGTMADAALAALEKAIGAFGAAVIHRFIVVRAETTSTRIALFRSR